MPHRFDNPNALGAGDIFDAVDALGTVAIQLTVSDVTHNQSVDPITATPIVPSLTVVSMTHLQGVTDPDVTIPQGSYAVASPRHLQIITPVAVTNITAEITDISPASPIDGAQAVISVTNDPTQQPVVYNGVTLNVASWTPGSYTVNWPLATTGSQTGFLTDYDLTVGLSAPVSVQTSPQNEYEYVQIGVRHVGLAANDALFDDDNAIDTIEVGADYVYGVGSDNDPAIEWHLDEWYINGVPLNGWTFTYRIWDASLATWSNLTPTPETFNEIAQNPDPDSLAHAQTLTEPSLSRGVVSDNLAHGQTLTEPGLAKSIGAENMLHGQTLTEPVLAQQQPPTFTGNIGTQVSSQNVFTVRNFTSQWDLDPLETQVWTITVLPTGLSIDSGTGVISGTPTTVETVLSIVMTATDPLGSADSNAFDWIVQAVVPGTGEGGNNTLSISLGLEL